MFAQVEIDASRCKGCGLCTTACSRMLLKLSAESDDTGYAPVVMSSQSKCVGCALCAGMCPDLAIKVFSRQKNEFTGNLGRSFVLYSMLVSPSVG
jgi:2-oxoglutarate ferredoxin oxidoreductase subunit delta